MWPTDGKAVNEYDDPAMTRLVTEFARRVRDAVEAPAKAVEGEGSLDEPTATHSLHRMPQTGSLLFGRRDELELLDDAWNDYTNLVAFTAGRGLRKSALARVSAENIKLKFVQKP